MLPTVSYRSLFQGCFCSHFNFHLLHALSTHVFYVYHVYIMYMLCFCILCSYLSMSGLSFMSIKICSVLLTKSFCHLLIIFANSKDPDQGREECRS